MEISKNITEEKIQSVQDFDLTPVVNRFSRDRGISISSTKEIEKELKRYLLLSCSVENEGYSLKSDSVDELWHTFLLFSEIYFEFCNKICGYYIHHRPEELDELKPKESLASYERFLKMYEFIFTDIPPKHIWPNPIDLHSSSLNCYPKCASPGMGTGGM